MRVALVNLTAGGLSRGYLKYLRRLVPLLLKSELIRALDVFVPPASLPSFAHEPWPVRTWPAADGKRGFRVLRRSVCEAGPDVVFVPSARWLDFGALPVVCMVRNMEPLEVPFGGNSLREGLRNMARAFVARRACRRATRVIAVSDHVRDYLVRRWRLATDRIAVVYHGVDSPPTDSESVRPSTVSADLSGRFIFSAGSIRPARGLEDLVNALPHLLASGLPADVVIAGEPDAGTAAHRERLGRRAHVLGVADRIIWAGGLDEASMRWCYERCAAFVMTSRAEACPNVALEAMSHGCACVSVNRAPMPEFFDDAATYYSLGVPSELGQRLTELLSNEQARSELKALALRRATCFDWNRTAVQTLTQLRLAIGV